MLSSGVRIYNKRMANPADVLILGGGVIGLSAAFHLAARGARVCVIDQGEMGREASWAGAGIIPPGRPEQASGPFDRLRALSSSMFPDLSGELRESTGIDIGYRRCGGLEFPADEPIDTGVWDREGISWEEFKGESLRRLVPPLAPGLGPAYHLPDMAQVRNPWYVRALVAAAAARGVTLRPGCPVSGFSHEAGRITAVQTGGRLVAGHYLVCAGAWSDLLLCSLGVQLGVRPVRGQIALLRTRSPILSTIVLRGKHYIVPRADGRVLVGSTEEDAGFDKATTAAAIANLLRFAAEMVPTLGGAAVEQCWAGLRPGSRDGLPSIGRVPGFDNLWVAAGHYRAGIQLSPATGRVLAEALTGAVPSVPLEAFRPDRPPSPPARPAFRS
jgi:glycine oxidase